MDRREHTRFVKRLKTKFYMDEVSFTGISSNISKSGLFIRTSKDSFYLNEKWHGGKALGKRRRIYGFHRIIIYIGTCWNLFSKAIRDNIKHESEG